MSPLPEISQVLHAIVASVEDLGLWAVLILAAADSFGLPATGDAALLIWSGLRTYPLGVVMVVAFAGASVGDNGAYWAGRLVGARIVRRVASPERAERVTSYINRHAAKALVGSRLLAALRTKVAVLAGAAHDPYPRFLVWNTLGCGLWAVVYGLLGRLVGNAVGVTSLLDRIGLVALVAIVLAATLLLAQRVAIPRWFGRHQKPPG